MSQSESMSEPPANYSYPLRVYLIIAKHEHRGLSVAPTCFHLITCFLNSALVIAGKNNICKCIIYVCFGGSG